MSNLRNASVALSILGVKGHIARPAGHESHYYPHVLLAQTVSCQPMSPNTQTQRHIKDGNKCHSLYVAVTCRQDSKDGGQRGWARGWTGVHRIS